MLIIFFKVSCVFGICKTSRPNLNVYLGFSVCSFEFLFHFLWCCFSIYSQISFVILETFTDVKWKKGIGTKPVCSWPRVGHSEEEQKGPSWFLRWPKATNRSALSRNISKNGLAIWTGDPDLSHLPETQCESNLFCNLRVLHCCTWFMFKILEWELGGICVSVFVHVL